MENRRENPSTDNDIVVSSRLRLARNMKKFPFPTIKDPLSGKKIIGEVFQSIAVAMKENEKVFRRKEIKDLTEIQRLQMMEKHLISPQLANNYETGAVVHNEEETLIIMINEEDHIRIQSLLPGLQLEETLIQANQIDDVIEEQIDYAFDEKFGYLTACPTNVGTGMRASVMLHLPALSMSDQIHGMLQFANKIGLAVRGVYGEGSDFIGNLYQISNQVTLGVSEEEIIEKLKEVTLQIINKERVYREDLIKEHGVEIADQVFRSLGILKTARVVSLEEGMKLLSDVQLGSSLGLLNNLEITWIHQLITLIQPGSLQSDVGKELDSKAQNIHRASLLRSKFGNH
jgi:protein arginine kinase